MVTFEHPINGQGLGGFSGDEISPKNLGIGFFQRSGLLKYLAKRFHGRVGDALDFAFSQLPVGETLEVISEVVVLEYLRTGDRQDEVKVVDQSPNPDSEGLTCPHHWLIETPRGTFSKGTCKRCGDERDFRNSANDHLWEEEIHERLSHPLSTRGRNLAGIDFD